jgi:hypothetical protein
MVAKKQEQDSKSRRGPRFLWGWLIGLVALSAAAFYFYYQYLQSQEVLLNSHYFRSLTEVSSEFNARLDQFVRVHKFEQTEASIRAIFPSYQPGPAQEQEQGKALVQSIKADSFWLSVGGNSIALRSDSETEPGGIMVAKVDIDDVLPAPRDDFSSYLLVGPSNKVLGATGGQRGYSMINTRDLSEKIWEEKGRDWLALATKTSSGDAPSVLPLPGYSYEIDMELASGKARMFVLPFNVDAPLSLDAESKPDLGQTAVHLVGAVPESFLNQKDNRRWQVGLLLLALVALGFVWTTLRLAMLSGNQPVGGLFYVAVLFFSFSLFVLSAALLFSWGEQRAEVEHKHAVARELLGDVERTFKKELGGVLTRLDTFREYYLGLLNPDPETTTREAAGPCEGDANAFDKMQLFKDEPDLQQLLLTLPPNEPVGGILLSDGSRWFLTEGGCYERFNVDPAADDVDCDLVNTESGAGGVGSEPTGETPASETGRFEKLTEQPNLINLYAKGVNYETESSCDVWFDPDRSVPGNILNVFLMDQTGQQVLPTFYYVENSTEPKKYNLSHRDYFKKVRDQQHWGASADAPEEGPRQKFYIQRLLNLTTGTRGTTLGTELLDPGEKWKGPPEIRVESMILGSDIMLPSLTFATVERRRLLDTSIMVVDQRTGGVLYHVDESRSMVENLFHAGWGADAISQRISLGRGTSTPIAGYYHGERGWYHTRPLALVPWSLVVFVPATNTDSYMTNLFLVNSAIIAVTLLFIVLGLLLVQRFVDTGKLKRRIGVPLIVESRRIVLFASVFVPVILLGYWLGSALERSAATISEANFSILLASAALLACLLWGVSRYTRFYLRARKDQLLRVGTGRGAAMLTLIFLGVGIALISYLDRVSREPVGALQWYYGYDGTLGEARLHKKRIELEQVALTRYPNSITRYRIDPLDFMPISDDWRRELRGVDTVALPNDVGSFNELTRNTRPWQWVERYLLAAGPGSSVDKKESDFPRAGPEHRYYVLMTTYFGLLVLLWLWFNQRVLAVRLFGPPGLLRHLNDCAGRKPAGNLHRPSDKLVLDLSNAPVGGSSLGLKLQQLKKNPEAESGIGVLVSLCPLLERAADGDNPFPCMKVKVSHSHDLQSLELWDLESCLVRAGQRALLLQLIQELKSLCVAGDIGELRIYLGFHTLERLLLKSNTLVAPGSEDEGPSSREYAAWAECLVDFRVELPDDLVEPADKGFIERESRHFPLLDELTSNIREKAQSGTGRPVNERRWFNLRDWQKTPAEWASINAILLTAGAMYRSKWEACSNAEKLALYHLALHKRINPSNTEMLEQLALEGLIIVHRGRIHIVNNSFAYFVRHAEDAETLKELVESGEAGAWRDYRLPITLLILLAIGAISLTSGNSLYVITASVLGLLGTLGTLTNSARLIKENLSR